MSSPTQILHRLTSPDDLGETARVHGDGDVLAELRRRGAKAETAVVFATVAATHHHERGAAQLVVESRCDDTPSYRNLAQLFGRLRALQPPLVKRPNHVPGKLKASQPRFQIRVEPVPPPDRRRQAEAFKMTQPAAGQGGPRPATLGR